MHLNLNEGIDVKQIRVTFYTNRNVRIKNWTLLTGSLYHHCLVDWFKNGNYVKILGHKYYYLNQHKVVNLIAMLIVKGILKINQ